MSVYDLRHCRRMAGGLARAPAVPGLARGAGRLEPGGDLRPGLGKILPRGAVLPVPFFSDVFVGEPVPWGGDRKAYLAALREAFEALEGEGRFADWE
jgi:hypothetical protein